jgi:hypothetical protein
MRVRTTLLKPLKTNTIMKKIIYLLAVAMVFSSFSFKPAAENLKIAKNYTDVKKQLAKKKVFSNVSVSFYNPVEGGGYHLKLTDISTLAEYTFDIPEYGVTGYLGTVPQGNYDVDIWSTYDTHSYLLLIGSDVEGTLGGYGPVMHDINIPVYHDQTVSITN